MSGVATCLRWAPGAPSCLPALRRLPLARFGLLRRAAITALSVRVSEEGGLDEFPEFLLSLRSSSSTRAWSASTIFVVASRSAKHVVVGPQLFDEPLIHNDLLSKEGQLVIVGGAGFLI